MLNKNNKQNIISHKLFLKRKWAVTKISSHWVHVYVISRQEIEQLETSFWLFFSSMFPTLYELAAGDQGLSTK